MSRAFWSLVVLVAGLVSISGQSNVVNLADGTSKGEWPYYAGDVRGTRFSPLEQINASNFNQLEVAWRFKTDNLGSRPEFKLEGTPVMVKGVIYTTAGSRRAVIALDAKTGEQLWVFNAIREGMRAGGAPRQLSGRGVSYWTDNKGDDRIIYVTTGYRLVALNAKNGQPIPSFGRDGIVDMKVGAVFGRGQQIDLESGEIGLHTTPTIAGDVVLVGSSFKEGMTIKTHNNTKGMVRAYDARSGRVLWQFNTIAKPGEVGGETWEQESWAANGNTGVWSTITVDQEAGLVYLPVETPSSDFYGGHRPGDNLFAESLVAVDLKTGVRKWHFQFIHHGIWDHDMSSAPMLVDLVVDGKPIKAVACPSKPPAYARTFVKIPDDVIDFTPQLRAEGLNLLKRYRTDQSPYVPYIAGDINGLLGSINIGNTGGGTNWPGAGLDPETKVAYLPASNSGVTAGSLVEGPPGYSDIRYLAGMKGTEFRLRDGPGFGSAADAPRTEANAAIAGVGLPAAPALSVQGLPIVKPPYGVLSAIDMNKGDLLWQVAHGDTPDVVRNHPLLKGLNIPKTGQNGAVGLVITRTLVVMGDPQVTTPPGRPRGAMLRAYDKKTGAEVGAVWMPAQQSGSPMTYMLDGKQYIVVAVSGGNYSGEYIAFRLPE